MVLIPSIMTLMMENDSEMTMVVRTLMVHNKAQQKKTVSGFQRTSEFQPTLHVCCSFGALFGIPM